MALLLFDEHVRAGKGRCAIARERIASGARVLHTHAVASLSLVACNWCFQSPADIATTTAAVDGGAPRPTKPLRRCGGCKRLKYCSSKCQQLDWTRGRHARECSAYTNIPASVRDSALQTLLLVARLAYQLYVSADASSEHDRTSVEQLRAHYDDHAASKLQQFRDMAQLVLRLLSRFKLSADERARVDALSTATGPSLSERIVQLFCRVNCNAFTVSSAACAPRGIGVFPRGALFNHSCAPNCVVSFEAQRMNVRTIAAIEAGDELTVSYVELFESTAKRQQALRDSYFFHCTCERCVAAATSLDDAYLDGHACSVASCRDGVVVAADGTSTPSCRVCLTERHVPPKQQELERECNAIRQQLQDASTAATDRTLRLFERLETLLLRDLALHPRNTRVATFWRDFGTFLLTASPPPRSTDSSELPMSSSRLPMTALEAFTRELRATEWVLPVLKLPPRGLLHFQLGKLVLEREQNGLGSSPGLVQDDHSERAMQHFHHALTILSCAYGPENALVRAVQAHLDELQWTVAARAEAH